ncbi:beta-ketoacyl reductase, partial [Streptomyces pacificus]|uniref:beta-ketoacyl reductase n=1 Tax=Streptomyces pacificus TaxID=2705029 RepID=UPI0015641803
ARRVDLPTYPFDHRRYWPRTPRPDTTGTDPLDTEFWTLVDNGRLDTIGITDQTLAGTLRTWRAERKARTTTEGWRYRDQWIPVTLSGTPSGTWLVVTPEGVADEDVVAAIGTSADVVRVEVGEGTDRAGLAARLADLAVTPSGVVALTGLVGTPGRPTGLALTVTLVQALADAGISALVRAVTRRAVYDDVAHPAQSALWGLGRVAALDLPKSWGGLIDLPEETDDRVASHFAAALVGTEDQVAVRTGGVYARRLVRATARHRPEFRTTGTALITGGTGALGGHVARWLAGAGAGHLVLTSRRGAEAPGAE